MSKILVAQLVSIKGAFPLGGNLQGAMSWTLRHRAGDLYFNGYGVLENC
jgi:hypothetical protein